MSDGPRRTRPAPDAWTPMADPEGFVPRVPGHEILELIGSGGQGRVYRARQVSTSRDVAVKVLPTGRDASEIERRRFDREADLVAMFDHPNLVALLDRGEVEGHPWFATRLVDGDDLDAWVARTRPSLRQRMEIFVACCAGVAHAHARGVIHRDLKPSNIRVDRDGRPHVLDFGLGKPLADDIADLSSLTMDGRFVGTLAHAAPEQLAGDHTFTDVRTDVHALGLVLYWLLAERLPYSTEGTVADVLERVRASEPVPPSRWAPGIGGDLDTITLKALARDPARRYQTVHELGEDVARWLRGEPIAARRDSAWYVLTRTVGRHRLAAGAALAVLGTLALSSVVLARQRNAAVAARALAESESARARAEAATSDHISRAFAGILDLQSAGTRSSRPEDMRVVDMLDRARAEVLPPLEGDPLVRGRVALALAKAYSTLGNWPLAHELVPEFEPLVDDESAPARDRLEALQFVTRAAHARAGHSASLPLEEKAAALVRRLDAELPPRFLPIALSRLGSAYVTAARLDEGMRLLDEARGLLEERAPGDLLLRAKLLERLPDGMTTREDDEARRTEVLALYEKHYGGPSRAAADFLSRSTLSAVDQGRLDEAEDLARASIAMFGVVHESDHPQTASAHTNLGFALASQGRHDEALDEYRLALEMFRGTVGEDVHSVAQVLENIALSERAMGRRQAEAQAWRRTLEWHRRHGKPEDVARVETELAASRAP